LPQQLDFDDILRTAPPIEARLDLWTPDDIFESLTADLIDHFGEDYRLDRKSARKLPRDFGPDISAFANTPPHGGVILIGIENDGRVTGFDALGRNRLNEMQQLSDSCPDASLDYRHIPVVNDKGRPDVVLAVRVRFRGNRLVLTANGDAYVRQGDQKRRLTDDEKREIRISRGEIEYEREPVALVYPKDFEMTLVNAFTTSFTELRRLGDEHSREDILALNQLGTLEDGVFTPNLACALLFAKQPRAVCPGARIRFQRFDGTTEGTGDNYNLIRDDFIDGPIPLILQDAEEIIAGQMRNFTRLGKNGRFYTKPEYPKDAWIEAVTNALVHRSYNYKNMVVFVKMFEDRFTVESPGGFLPPVTPENIYDVHNPRNPFLMEALFYFGFVKCAHEGTRRMRDAMEDVGLPNPEFSQKAIGQHQVHATLRNNSEARKTFVDEDAAKIIGARLFSSLDMRERMVINYIASHNSINVSDANRILQCDWRTAKNLLDKMVASNLLDRVSVTGRERDPKARYVIHGKE
jgi:ATP-dependent DNA helicase RecG